jgi:glycogen operon protein
MDVQARPGRPFPLGVHLRDGGANVAVYSSVADAVELCLYDEHRVETRVRLPGKDDGIWHAFVPGQAAGPQ